MAVVAAVPLTTAQNWYLVALTAGPLVVCVGFTAICAGQLGVFARVDPDGKRKWSGHMGQGQWDFSTSFATNIAVIGSVLTLILNSGIFETARTSILPSATYSGLGIIFGSVAVVAPLLYNGTAHKSKVRAAQRDTAAEYHGTVWGFFLAAVATQWALVGSVLTVFMTLLELLHDDTLSITPVVLLGLTLSTAIVFFGRYSWVKIQGTVEDQYDAPRPPAARQPLEERALLAPESIAPQSEEPPAPNPRPWTLL
jgi:hypothetical protein